MIQRNILPAKTEQSMHISNLSEGEILGFEIFSIFHFQMMSFEILEIICGSQDRVYCTNFIIKTASRLPSTFQGNVSWDVLNLESYTFSWRPTVYQALYKCYLQFSQRPCKVSIIIFSHFEEKSKFLRV